LEAAIAYLGNRYHHFKYQQTLGKYNKAFTGI